MSGCQRVAVIHPDLGVGGAERLIIDASKALQCNGLNTVDIYTGYHDRSRCFDETRDGTLNVITIGQWIPRSIFGRCHALIAYLKMVLIAIYLMLFTKSYDLILCDQVSACIPIFKIRNFIKRQKIKIVFYCHFPDQLLTSRESLLKQLYRIPLDKFEEWSTSLADVILVNSEFTGKIVKQTFNSLKDRQLDVLYPCVDLNKFEKYAPTSIDYDEFKRRYSKLKDADFILLSINRFERKKDLGLAIRELVSLRSLFELKQISNFERFQLVIAGGYDERLQDCVDYYKELINLVAEYSLEKNVTFLKSPDDREKLILLGLCDALIYTPQNEHFGIVPIEAMAMSKPVIACASGGPLETITHGVTGFLCGQDKFHLYMSKLALDKSSCESMGKAGYRNVVEQFSFERFSQKLVRNLLC